MLFCSSCPRLYSCGCSTGASYYPTAALSQAAYGSSVASGPACGMCFNLTLRETFGAVPTWTLSEEQQVSVVVKIVVSCSILPPCATFLLTENVELLPRISARRSKGSLRGRVGVERQRSDQSESPFFPARTLFESFLLISQPLSPTVKRMLAAYRYLASCLRNC